MDIRSEILKKVKPSRTEEEKISVLVKQIIDTAKKISGLEAVAVGSIGKFTWLTGDHDIDIFIMFDYSVQREELERLGLEYGKRIAEELKGKWRVKYAEHPYTNATIHGYNVDIVPCYIIRPGERIKSAVDRSPLHLKYVLDYMKPTMVDDIRLLKQFCKGIGVYGSDAKNQGFSGYICELLVLHYLSFENVMEAAAEWEPPFVINIEQHLGVPLNKFRDHPLVIVDPVDPNRNVGAVVSGQNMIKFISSAKKFRNKPSTKFFFPSEKKPMTALQIKQLQKRETKFVGFEFRKSDVIDDVLYPQLRRATNRLLHLLEHNEFRVLRATEFVDKNCYIILELETWSLPAVKKMIGPSILIEKHSREFLSKYSENFVYIEDDKWVADVPRGFKTAVDLLNTFLKDTPENLAEKGIPKYIATEIAKKKVIEHHAFWKMIKGGLSDHLRVNYFVDDSNDFLPM